MGNPAKRPIRMACAGALLACAAWQPGWATAPRIPTAVFAQRPSLSKPIVSPDGSHIAAMLDVKGKQFLGVMTIDGKLVRTQSVGESTDINWFRWAGNDTLLVSIGKTISLHTEEAWQTRLIALDYATGALRFIGGKREGLIGDDVLWIDPAGKSVLLAFQRTIYEYPSVYRIELATNAAEQVVGERNDIWDWYADQTGAVRTGIGYSGTRWFMIYRTSPTDKWRTVVKARVDDDEDAGFDAFRIFAGSDQGYRVMLNEATGRYALYAFDFATRQRGALVLESKTNDIDDFDTDAASNKLRTAWFTEDAPRVHWFDAAMQKTQAALDKALPGAQPTVVSRSRDGSVMIVRSGNSGDPGGYYVFKAKERRMSPFAVVNENLDPAVLSPSRYVSYKARDGLEIPAYLTLPKGRGAKNLPLIVMPHGGPYDVRDDGSYDPDVQFLANRGYAVLQPEFRGSGGYGKAFYEKGEGQWGRAMQDDLDDAMDWLAREGTIDPKRVCVVGGSYGGYAALWGAVRNPERYRCAASFAGISDLPRQLRYQVTFRISKRYRKDWRRIVRGEEAFDLRTVSPLHSVARLTVPVLLMHGDEDQRVPFHQSRFFADKLKAAGKTYEFYPLKGEGHGFSTSANHQQWLDRLEAFLAKHNPADG